MFDVRLFGKSTDEITRRRRQYIEGKRERRERNDREKTHAHDNFWEDDRLLATSLSHHTIQKKKMIPITFLMKINEKKKNAKIKMNNMR